MEGHPLPIQKKVCPGIFGTDSLRSKGLPVLFDIRIVATLKSGSGRGRLALGNRGLLNGSEALRRGRTARQQKEGCRPNWMSGR